MNNHEAFSNQERETLNQLLNDYQLSPQQIAVITALIFNALNVKAIVVDIDQTVEVVLVGSLKKTSKNMEKLINEIRGFNVGQILELLNRKGSI